MLLKLQDKCWSNSILLVCCSWFLAILQVSGTSLFNMAPSAKKWDGNTMSQNDMMLKDTVIVLDNQDNIVGSASKKESHVFNSEQPRGILHRAFSVFLFDESTGELLLQQRASTKITFPNVSISFFQS